MPADESRLDNPIWHALVGPHAALAIGTAMARRYPPAMAMFAGFPDGAPDWAALAALVTPGEVVFIGNLQPPLVSGFEVVFASDTAVQQYVYRGPALAPAANPDLIELHHSDAPEMQALIDVTRPGPFFPRTNELGPFTGLRAGGRLVAMAGERLHPPGYCEISAVCTHPDYARRGYAAQLVNHRIAGIQARGETPFLHVSQDNASAIRLYEKLGFVHRASFPVQILKFVGAGTEAAAAAPADSAAA